ncbi:MAG: hypothetical protein L6R39_006429, partial [Caloplaca ligustica]
MERAQARQNTPSDPTTKLPLHYNPGGKDPDARTGVQRFQFLLQPLAEAVDERGAADDDDIGEEVRTDVDVDLREGILDEGG